MHEGCLQSPVAPKRHNSAAAYCMKWPGQSVSRVTRCLRAGLCAGPQVPPPHGKFNSQHSGLVDLGSCRHENLQSPFWHDTTPDLKVFLKEMRRKEMKQKGTTENNGGLTDAFSLLC